MHGVHNPVWSYDGVFDRTADGRPLRMLAMADEHTRGSASQSTWQGA